MRRRCGGLLIWTRQLPGNRRAAGKIAAQQGWTGRQVLGAAMCPGDQRESHRAWTLGISAAAGRTAILSQAEGSLVGDRSPADEVAAWRAALTRAAEAETCFLAVPGFIAGAVRGRTGTTLDRGS